MTPSPHSAGAATSAPSSSATPTSKTSAPANHPPGRKPLSLPSLPARENPRGEGASSLYALGIQAQEISGELALAAELLGTDDPQQEETAIALIEQYLEAQGHTQSLIESKADNICRYIDSLNGLAEFRRNEAKRLTELADADAKRAQSLKDYMLGVLTRLYPDQARFSLPTHELKRRPSKAVEIEDEDLIPDDLFRTRTTRLPDKTAIKAAIEGGQDIPGARIVHRTNWTIK